MDKSWVKLIINTAVLMSYEPVVKQTWKQAVAGDGVGTRTWSETRCLIEAKNDQRHGRRGVLAAPCYVWSH